MTQKPRKSRPRPINAWFMRPDVWTVAKMIRPLHFLKNFEGGAVRPGLSVDVSRETFVKLSAKVTESGLSTGTTGP